MCNGQRGLAKGVSMTVKGTQSTLRDGTTTGLRWSCEIIAPYPGHRLGLCVYHRGDNLELPSCERRRSRWRMPLNLFLVRELGSSGSSRAAIFCHPNGMEWNGKGREGFLMVPHTKN